MGDDRELHWASAPRAIDFYDIKGCIEDLVEALQSRALNSGGVGIPFLFSIPGRRQDSFRRGGFGLLGEVHPQVLERYEIPGRAYLFEIDFEQLVKHAREGKWFRRCPDSRPFIGISQLSLMMPWRWKRSWKPSGLSAPLHEEVTLFDIYRGAPIPEGKKGVSFRIRYQANDRTLTDEEVNQGHEKLISRLKEIFPT